MSYFDLRSILDLEGTQHQWPLGCCLGFVPEASHHYMLLTPLFPEAAPTLPNYLNSSTSRHLVILIRRRPPNTL